METNQSLSTVEDLQPCSTCDELKKNISELDEKLNFALSKIDFISRMTKELTAQNQHVTDSNGAASLTALPQHDPTRSATEVDEYGIYAKNSSHLNNSSSNYLVGARKRKPCRNEFSSAAPKISKQEEKNDSYLKSSKQLLSQKINALSSSREYQKVLVSSARATMHGGPARNNVIVTSFSQTKVLQNDPNVLSTAAINGIPITRKDRVPTKTSSKQTSATSSPATLPNEQRDDLTEDELRAALAISAEAKSKERSDSFATQMSALRRIQSRQLLISASSRYYRILQAFRPTRLSNMQIETGQNNGPNCNFSKMTDDNNTNVSSASYKKSESRSS